jgi:co-chaperonin GroES (HSP10)
MATLHPLNNVVMFKFLEDTGGQKGRFHEQVRASGIIIPTTVGAQKVHRWGQVFAAGPKAEVKEGDYILVEALMWMEGIKWEDGKVWKTDDSKILAVTDDINDCQSQAL